MIKINNYLLFVPVISFLAGIVIIPIVVKIANKYRIYDHPGIAKIQKEPVPYLGGVAIFCSCIVSITFAAITFKIYNSLLIGYVTGSFIILIFGLLDDLDKISPAVKFIGMIIGGLVLIFNGIKIEFIGSPVLDIILTLFYVVGLVNALNLLDGLDGLAAGVSAVASFFLLGLSAIESNILCIIISLGLIGACLSFLKYNFNPASIFMGDAGSMFLGFSLITVVIMISPQKFNYLQALVPLVVVGVPIADTSFAIFRRLIKGDNIFTGDRGHSYDLIIDSGLSLKKTVLLVYLAGFVLGAIAIFIKTLN